MATGVVGLFRTLGNFVNSVFLGGARPKFNHNLDKTNGMITVEIPPDQPRGKVVLRRAHTLSHRQRDFRLIAGATEKSDGSATCKLPRIGPRNVLGSDVCFQPIVWEGTTLNAATPGLYVGKIPPPTTGWIGAYVEVYFPSDTGLE